MSDDSGDGSHGLITLASAIAGRAIQIAYLTAGEPSWTDGRRVHIDPTRPRPEQRRTVALHASLIATGGLDPAILRRLGRNPGRAARYLAVEGHRALLTNAPVLPRDVLLLLDRDTAALTESAGASLALARGHRPLPPIPDCFGIVRPHAVLATATADRQPPIAAGTHHPRSRTRRDLEPLADDAAADDGCEIPTSPVGGGGPLGRLFRKLLGAARKPGSAGPPGAESAGYLGHHGRRGAAAVRSSGPVRTGPPDPEAHDRAALTYPEWDSHRRRYRDRWCTVAETEPDPDPRPWRIPENARGLRRPLARLGTAPTRVRRQAQGDDLDIDAVVESRVRFLSGSTPEEAVYLDTLRHRRDLSVLVLLDISGSVAETDAHGTPIHDRQRTAAAALVSALYHLGDRVALYAFRSRGRGAVQLFPVKRFDEVFGTAVLRRLSGLTAGAYSRLGAAIRHGSAILRTRGGTGRRLLVVISDGLAYDHGYERAYGAADAHRALAEARRDGVGCLCLTIGASTGDSDLAAVFGSAAHVTIPDTDRLTEVVGPLFREALHASGTAPDATFRRRERRDR